ncbi:MAG: acetyl-CoA carboxylase biotin carboxyl carrier protein subunit [Oscillibacter sp.]|jgi:biotin carboxyl carrier protein|nr:acetyl-CoA carboxylase biotin carboxyl carrier protein subunit [Oscillibacter sp.]
MKKYRVTVNGTAYEIELEELTGAAASAPAAPVAAAPAPAAAPVAAAVPAGGEKVSSPMPGTILSINVAAGDAVKKGQVLMILEAMKMENEIMCPCDGKIASVNTSKGAAVESGTLLCVIQ